jgi:hypothetical protein
MVFSVLAVLMLFVLLHPAPVPAVHPIALIHINVIDATGSPTASDVTVIIRGDRIVTIGKSRDVAIPSDANVIDASGKFLIPGLWDMHVHALESRARESVLATLLANGILGVRDMGSSREALREFRLWREKSKSASALVPRVVASGPMIDGPSPMFPTLSIGVRTETEAREAVALVSELGANFIKVYSLLPRDAYFAIADESRRRGLPFSGHVPDSVTAAEASDAGQNSIEHLSNIWLNCSRIEDQLRDVLLKARASKDPLLVCRALTAINTDGVQTYDREKARLLFRRFVRNRTWQVPTLVTTRAVMPMRAPNGGCTEDLIPSASDGKREGKKDDSRGLPVNAGLQRLFELVREMHEAGVDFMAGTDAPNPLAAPGISLHTELEFLVRSGFSPMEALRAATIRPAEYLGLQAQLGTVEPGKIANLVLLEADPLADISNTRRIAGVVLGGRLIWRSELEPDVIEATDLSANSQEGPPVLLRASARIVREDRSSGSDPLAGYLRRTQRREYENPAGN